MYGAETVILNLSRTLNESSHSSILGVFSNSSNPNLQLHEAAVSEGIESHIIPCNGQIDRAVVANIRRLAAQTRADIVHAHGYKADVYVYFALRRSGTPFVSTCHNWLKGDPVVYFYGTVDRYVLRSYAAVIAVSDEVKSRLLSAGVRKDKVYSISNGIDLRPFIKATAALTPDPAPAMTLTVGWIGRLSPEKGADIFLRAAAQVLIQCPQTRFLVIGDGPEIAMLHALANELKIKENVLFMGRRGDMPSVYASVDVMVSSSRQEGLPMAILEGMASALPMVVTAVGDVPVVVLDGSTGIVVPPENVDLLAGGIVQLLQSADLRASYGAAARKRVEREFSAQRMTTNYLETYREALRAAKK